jgi:hypothetical protein
VSFTAPLIVIALAFVILPAVSAQQVGSIEFIARVTPTGGHPEPARDFTFYLLRKSFQDIQKEADAAEASLNMDEFIAKVEGSPELTTWMKKHQIVDLAGPEFVKALAPVDILGIPEFKDAYFSRNKADPSVVLPQPHIKESDKLKNPDKYKQEVDDYQEALKKFIAANPDTLSSMFLALAKMNPGPRWKKMVNERDARVHRRTLELAELHYLAGKTDTDLEGRGQMNGLAPGDYWLTTLDAQANAGDARVRWNLPVTVPTGHISLDLNNLNGVASYTP